MWAPQSGYPNVLEVETQTEITFLESDLQQESRDFKIDILLDLT